MLVSEVSIDLIQPREGLIGFANIILEGQLYLGSIGIHKKLNSEGYRLTYPTKKLGSKQPYVFHPISKEMSEVIEASVLDTFKDVVSKAHVRHGRLSVE